MGASAAGRAFAAQEIADSGIAAGLSDIGLGLRLRYEIARAFAPCIGVSWDRRFGGAASDEGGGFSLVAGGRAWF